MTQKMRHLIAAFALFCMLVPASDAVAPARTLRFEHLSVEQGLAQESVLAIVQDRDGFMWFGSQAGLSRFDGYRVVVYRHEIDNPKSLVNNWVRVLHVDARGDMWIGTDGGINRYDPATTLLTNPTNPTGPQVPPLVNYNPYRIEIAEVPAGTATPLTTALAAAGNGAAVTDTATLLGAAVP